MLVASIAATTSAGARCNELPFARTQPLVERLFLNPAGLLAPYGEGGPALEGLAFTIVSSDTVRTIQPMIALSRSANDVQQRSIANGLALAVIACMQGGEAALAERVKSAVQASRVLRLTAAFNLMLTSQSASGAPPGAPKQLGAPGSRTPGSPEPTRGPISLSTLDPAKPVGALPSPLRSIQDVTPVPRLDTR